MKDSPSLSSSSSASTSMSPTKSIYTDDKNKDTVGDSVITINEKVSLTKQQHQVLKIICNTYELHFRIYATSTS
jgi:hypothetical protein